jgi:hypothetical protein
MLHSVRRAARRERVALRDVLSATGNGTITPIILIVCLLLVSPLSGIPGVPTICAVIIVTLALQSLLGRRRLWLPEAIMRLRIRRDALRRSIDWLRRPALWADRNSKPRLEFLTRGPMRYLVMAQCAIIPLGWPALELVPGVTSFAAATVALFAFGLFTRDGLYVLAGYAMMLAVPIALFLAMQATLS